MGGSTVLLGIGLLKLLNGKPEVYGVYLQPVSNVCGM